MKLRADKNKRISYYAIVVKRLGKPAVINEKFVFSLNTGVSSLSQGKIGEFAIFTADLLKNNEKAERYFLRAIEKSPQNYIWLGNYALFLHYYKRDLPKALQYYEASLNIYANDVFFKFNYILLLLFLDKDVELIEKLFKDIIKLEPGNLKYKCFYASFLYRNKHEYLRAEGIYRRIIFNNRTNPLWFASYAQLMILRRDYVYAENLIDYAFHLNPSEELSLEMWFYAYAHLKNKRDIALQKINELLNNNTIVYLWKLEQYIDLAIKEGHPEPEKLQNLAKQIMNK